MDSIGKNIKLTLSGASHAPSVGCVLEGLPCGFKLDMDAVRFDLERRRAGNYALATPRREADDLIIVSGIKDGVTDGGPVSVTFPNREHDKNAYSPVARPSHADYAAWVKSGGAEDISGGGRYSGRMTLPLTFAGSVVRQLLKADGITVFSHISYIGSVEDAPFDPVMERAPELDPFFPLVDRTKREPMERLISETRDRGDTLACGLECAALGVPAGLGEPLFSGVESTLSRYLFMIPGLRGIDFADMRVLGSEMNDQFADGGRTVTNRSFGINGGIANGMPLIVKVRFRPVPSIGLPQTGYDLIGSKPVPLEIKGRHDTAILPRGAAAVEAAVCLGLYDLLLDHKRES
ncbi:MAG: chorismate synthase [Clostridia bacterium]|nr:chorismate synthase [Clostridia bacterium]